MIDYNMNILVVDDNLTMQHIIISLLKTLKFKNVYGADNGFQALDMLKHNNYKLILSDWIMAPLDGIGLLKEIKKMPHLTDTKFIMITSETRQEKILRAKKEGVDQYIAKPFDFKIFKRKIELLYNIVF